MMVPPVKGTPLRSGSGGGGGGGGGGPATGAAKAVYRSCFYRTVPYGGDAASAAAPLKLTYTEHEKVFDPEEVYPGVPNPTKL